jgi:hypothetical protein
MASVPVDRQHSDEQMPGSVVTDIDNIVAPVMESRPGQNPAAAAGDRSDLPRPGLRHDERTGAVQ